MLSVTEGPFVPEGAALAEVERRWSALRASNPAYFDGRFCHVLGVHRNGYGGAVVHVTDCAYRFHAVQDDTFDLGTRPLGVKGLTVRRGQLLLGKRSTSVANYRGLWEFAPGGVVEPGRSPQATVLAELEEETGLRPAGEPVARAIVYDPVLRCWEAVFTINAADEPARIRTDEYDELRWCAPTRLPEALSPLARQLLPLLPRSEEGNSGP